MRVQYRILELFDAMLYSADFPEGFRAAVELRGFRVGRSRQPRSEKQKVDFVALQNVLRCILAEFGLVDPPGQGCPPRTGNIEQDRIQQIAAVVVQQLRERGADLNGCVRQAFQPDLSVRLGHHVPMVGLTYGPPTISAVLLAIRTGPWNHPCQEVIIRNRT